MRRTYSISRTVSPAIAREEGAFLGVSGVVPSDMNMSYCTRSASASSVCGGRPTRAAWLVKIMRPSLPVTMTASLMQSRMERIKSRSSLRASCASLRALTRARSSISVPTIPASSPRISRSSCDQSLGTTSIAQSASRPSLSSFCWWPDGATLRVPKPEPALRAVRVGAEGLDPLWIRPLASRTKGR